MFGFFGKREPEKPFAPVELSLIHPETLKEELAPFVESSGAEPSKLTGDERDKALGKIITAHFPQQTLAMLQKVALGEIREPVIIHNLPTEQETLNRISAKGRGGADKLYCSAIARGIYAALGIKATRNTILRRRHDGEHDIPGEEMHKDETQFSILASALNTARAGTRFIDLKTAIGKLSQRERESIIIEEYTSSRLLMTLEEFYQQNMLMGSYPENADAFTSVKIVGERCKNQRALKRFKNLLAEYSFNVPLKPGQLALFNNREIYHQASQEIMEVGIDAGDDEPTHSHLSRVVVFTSGVGQSR